MSATENPADSLIGYCYREILVEFPGDEKKTQQKIQRGLKYRGYPKAESQLLEELRKIHNALQTEIGLFHQSKYHLGYSKNVTSFEDFDAERMIQDFSAMFPSIPKEEWVFIIGVSIFGYYLR